MKLENAELKNIERIVAFRAPAYAVRNYAERRGGGPYNMSPQIIYAGRRVTPCSVGRCQRS